MERIIISGSIQGTDDKEEELRQLVNRLGMQMGLKAGDSYREDASGRSVISRENENSPGNNTGRLEYGGDPYVGQAVGQNQMPIKKAGRKQEQGRWHTKIPKIVAYLADREPGII